MTAVLPVRRPGAAQTLPPAEDTRSASDRSAGPARTLGLLAPWLVRGVVGLAVAVFALLAVGPHVLGYRTMTMLTGSMAPMIDPGDVTVVTPIAVEDVTEGMVLTYHQPIGDRALVTHRVVEVQRDTAGTSPSAPRATRTRPSTRGRRPSRATPPTGSAPSSRSSATLIQALRTPVVTQVLLYGAPALLAGWVLLSIWRPTTDIVARRTRHERRPTHRRPARPHRRRRHRQQHPGLGHVLSRPSPRRRRVAPSPSPRPPAELRRRLHHDYDDRQAHRQHQPRHRPKTTTDYGSTRPAT